MLKAFALDLHRGEDKAIAHKMRRIAHALRCLEAGNKKELSIEYGIPTTHTHTHYTLSTSTHQ